MNPSLATARHFARLVSLLLDGGSSADREEQLRALVAAPRDRAVAVSVEDGVLRIDGRPLPEPIAGAKDLSAQLAAHGVREVVFERSVRPADALGLARLLCEDAPEHPTRTLPKRVAALGAQTVRVVSFRSTAAGVAAVGAVAAAPASVPGGDDGDSVYHAFAARRRPEGTVPELLARLDAARGLGATLGALDDLVTLAEDAAQQAKHATAAAVYAGLVEREHSISHPEARRAYTMAIRRMTKPTVLRAVARMLVERPDALEDHLIVLDRAGADGADVLIEALAVSEDIGERRTLFSALTRLEAAVPSLVHLLGDGRWYVVRNAADLLGQLKTTAGEGELVKLVGHADERVRRAAVGALAAVATAGTPRATQALHTALRDESLMVRRLAARGLANGRGQASTAVILRALDEETDLEVIGALLTALGRVGTPEAVAKLVKVAEREGRLFRRKATPVRVCAVRALGEAKRSAEALSALEALREDRNDEVREAAAQAIDARGN